MIANHLTYYFTFFIWDWSPIPLVGPSHVATIFFRSQVIVAALFFSYLNFTTVAETNFPSAGLHLALPLGLLWLGAQQ